MDNKKRILLLCLLANMSLNMSFATTKQGAKRNNDLASPKASSPTVTPEKINLTGATFMQIGADKIRVFNVSNKQGKSNMDLQWNPFDKRFDVTTSGVHTEIGKCTTIDVPENGFFEIETNPENKSIEVRIVSKHTGAFGYTFNMIGNAANLHGIIQKGRQLSVTTNSANLNSMTALASLEPNYDGINSIPAGVMRVLTLTKLPSWFDFSAPVHGAIWRSVSYTCL